MTASFKMDGHHMSYMLADTVSHNKTNMWADTASHKNEHKTSV